MSVPSTGTNAVTEGWTVSYSAIGDEWTVVGTVAGEQQARAVTGQPYSSDDGAVSFTIAAGGTPFADGDQFTFSTFRTARPEGKRNEVEEGQTAVVGVDP